MQKNISFIPSAPSSAKKMQGDTQFISEWIDGAMKNPKAVEFFNSIKDDPLKFSDLIPKDWDIEMKRFAIWFFIDLKIYLYRARFRGQTLMRPVIFRVERPLHAQIGLDAGIEAVLDLLDSKTRAAFILLSHRQAEFEDGPVIQTTGKFIEVIAHEPSYWTRVHLYREQPEWTLIRVLLKNSGHIGRKPIEISAAPEFTNPDGLVLCAGQDLIMPTAMRPVSGQVHAANRDSILSLEEACDNIERRNRSLLDAGANLGLSKEVMLEFVPLPQ